MRRRVGLVLAGLGTCLIVFAVLMPAWVSSKVLKFPLNEYATATLTAGNVSYFSPTKLTEFTGVNMEATYTIKGNAAAGSSSTAVWNQFIYVYDQTNKLPFQTMTRTFAFDRRTAQLIDCCGANVNGDSSVEQTGIVGYVFPIGTKKQTYDVFDTNLNKPMPFTFAGTNTVNGIQAYRFEENVAPTQNGTQVVPGSLVGESQASVVLPQYYEMRLTYWIDPDTGALLNATEHERLTLRNSQGAQALLLLDANLAMTPTSVNGLVALDNTQRSKMSLVTTILPLVTGILGVIGLIVGILLSRRREDVEGGASATSAELAAAEPEDADRSAQSATRPSLVPGLDDEPHEAPAESPAVKQETAEPEAEAEPEAAELEAAEPEAEAEPPPSQGEPKPRPPPPRPKPPSPKPRPPPPPKPRLPRPRRPKLRPTSQTRLLPRPPPPRQRQPKPRPTLPRPPSSRKQPNQKPKPTQPTLLPPTFRRLSLKRPPSHQRPRTAQLKRLPPRCRRPPVPRPKPPRPTRPRMPPRRPPGAVAEVATAARHPSPAGRYPSRRKTSSRFQVRNSRSMGTRSNGRVQPGR